jgi:hypothetical protein
MKSSFPQTVRRAREQRATIAKLRGWLNDAEQSAGNLQRKLNETESRLRSLVSTTVTRNPMSGTFRLCIDIDHVTLRRRGRAVWDEALEQLRRGIQKESVGGW